MQKPIRYYITKRGEEPMVRSVKIALTPPAGDDRAERGAAAADEATLPPCEDPPPPDSVTRFVKSAIRKRSSRP